MSIKLYTDKTEVFECNVALEGVSIKESKLRAILKFEDKNLINEGKIKSGGKGQIVFPGLVEGKILVMKEYKPGPWPDFDILVAKHTDPGWSLLISKSKGLVVEQGGLLSHASIVTRELGIPCIIGVKEVTEKLTNGSNAILDASNGVLQIKNKDEN